MNPYSGATYALGDDLVSYSAPVTEPGGSFWPHDLEWGAENVGRELTVSEQAALRDPGPLVLVSERVAQKVQLGERELTRRKARRKQARQSRRRNR